MIRSFEEIIRLRSENDPSTGCWIWRGCLLLNGYGAIGKQGRQLRAHRVSAHVFKGFDLDSNLFVCHTCDNPACVNPDHLFIGTSKENTDDMMRKGRHRAPFGNASKVRKLSEEQARYVLHGSEDAASLAEKFRVSRKTIYAIRSGKNWKHLSRRSQVKS